MKYVFNIVAVIVLMSFNSSSLLAQSAPAIEWQNTIGGSGADNLYAIQQTADGGYILGGSSESGISTDKSEGSLGNLDYWVIKLTSQGSIGWQNTIGGGGDDNLTCLRQTADGGFILGGYSDSGKNGDKTEARKGGFDYWVIKLDNSGNIEWQNTIGGDSDDKLYSLDTTSDGGYIVAGGSASLISGDKTQSNVGGPDYWMVKLSSSGIVEWDKTIGGTEGDECYSIRQTSDEGYILGGRAYSGSSGDKSEASQGINDYWVVKTNSSGTIEWENGIGGTNDDILYNVQQTQDGGYILGGNSISGISSDKTESSIGFHDYWILKLNSSGAIEWQNVIGGNILDYQYALQLSADGGFILGGASDSNISGDKTETTQGLYDYWIVKVNNEGTIEWQNTIGGDQSDLLQSIGTTSDGGYILGGFSYSNASSDKTEANSGATDYWVVKLYPEDCNGILVYADNDNDGFGDAGNSLFAENCVAPAGYVINNADCNDANGDINPTATETCSNSIDEDCDNLVDENCVQCVLPASYSVNEITAHSANLKWDAVAGAAGYKLRYKVSGMQAWKIVSVSAHHKRLHNLLANTEYSWAIKTYCDIAPNTTSAWSETLFFATAAEKIASSVLTAFTISPNPVSQMASIAFSLSTEGKVWVELYDLQGKKMLTLLDERLNAGDHSLIFDRQTLPCGVYFIKLTMNEEVLVQKIILE